jgi:hypothetical protein
MERRRTLWLRRLLSRLGVSRCPGGDARLPGFLPGDGWLVMARAERRRVHLN